MDKQKKQSSRKSFEMSNNKPVLWIVIPCYNEEAVLRSTLPHVFLTKLDNLIESSTIDAESRLCLINDGSTDDTWNLMKAFVASSERIVALSLSRNCGHQNALLSGLMTAKDYCDIAISCDCDGQDDINTIDKMIREYSNEHDIVYGVRSSRDSDSFFKRKSAELFYKMMRKMGADVVYNHADFRLMSKRALSALSQYKEANLFLRGIIPLLGYPSTHVEYERNDRVAGMSHYSLSKMLSLAFDGITSLSIKPIHIVSITGFAFGLVGFAGLLWALITFLIGNSIPGWTSLLCAVFMMGGLQLLSIGVIGEYIGKTYLEAKQRPRYFVEEQVGL